MDEGMVIEPARGVYDTRRASALSGVSYRTLQHWASSGFFRPSINSEPRTRLWSWGDLLALRAIDWLRQRSKIDEAESLGSIPVHEIRRMLDDVVQDDVTGERLAGIVAIVDGGTLVFRLGDERPSTEANDAKPLRGRGTQPAELHLVAPFRRGPDLLRPRPLLRIIPGKLHGEPHVLRTRISSAVLYRLAELDYPSDDILEMYPSVAPEALAQALDLEQSLHRAA